MSSPPAVYKNVVICGSIVPDSEPQGPNGDVRASTRSPASSSGASTPSPNPASSAAIPGKVIPPKAAAARICGPSQASTHSAESSSCP